MNNFEKQAIRLMVHDAITALKFIASLTMIVVIVFVVPIVLVVYFLTITCDIDQPITQANLTSAARQWSNELHLEVTDILCQSNDDGNFCAVAHDGNVTSLKCARAHGGDVSCYSLGNGK